MTLFLIKLIAAGSMLIDHVGRFLFPDIEWMMFVGRLAFPLFAWAIANGYRHTRSVRKYSIRLGIFALVSQIPYQLGFASIYGDDFFRLNIFFTLWLGLLVILLYEWRQAAAIRWGLILAVVAIASVVPLDYGGYGVLLVFLFHRTFGTEIQMVNAIVLLTIVTITVFLLQLFSNNIWLQLFPDASPVQLFALAALPIVFFYNDKPGTVKYKWWFYWFYPVHLFVLWLIQIL